MLQDNRFTATRLETGWKALGFMD